MSANVEWFVTAARTYEIGRYDPDALTWSSIVTGQATSPYLDATGSSTLYYRVRDDTDGAGNESPWTPQFLGLAVDPETCNLIGYVYTSDGVAMQDALVAMKPHTDQLVQSLRYSVLTQVETYTDSDGKFEQALVRGLVLSVKIPDRDFQELVTIPDLAEANIDSLV